jgi:hypothetical protein
MGFGEVDMEKEEQKLMEETKGKAEMRIALNFCHEQVMYIHYKCQKQKFIH